MSDLKKCAVKPCYNTLCVCNLYGDAIDKVSEEMHREHGYCMAEDFMPEDCKLSDHDTRNHV